MTIKVGRFGNPAETVTANEGDTVGDVLNFVGISPRGNERINMNGEGASLSTQVTDGAIISVVSSKEAGI